MQDTGKVINWHHEFCSEKISYAGVLIKILILIPKEIIITNSIINNQYSLTLSPLASPSPVV
jgi:hypothetical protein